MLSHFSVKRPYTVIVGIALVIILGIVSFQNMTADLLPSMNLPYAVVITTYPGASPEEVELAVSKPVEASMASISNISNISSVSSENMSMVICEFEQSANMDSVTIEMRESLDQISTYWADSITNPMIMKLNPDMLPIMVASVDKEELTSKQITNLVEGSIVPEIESIEGVASVSATGYIEETIQVIIDQEKIDSLNKKIKKSLDNSFAEASEEMKKSQQELEEGKEELEAGKEEMAAQLAQAEDQLTSSQLEMLRGELEINKQLAEISQKEKELIAGEKEIATKEIELQKAKTELEIQKTQLAVFIEQLTLLQTSMEELEEQISDGSTAETELEQQLEVVYYTLSSMGINPEELSEALQEARDSEEKIIAAEKGIEAGLLEISSGKSELASGKEAIAKGKDRLEKAREEIVSGQKPVSEALEELNKKQTIASIDMSIASSQLNTGEKELSNAKTTLEEQKDSAYEKASLDNVISSDMVKGILAAQNFNMPAGYVTEEGIDYLVRVGDKIEDEEALENLIIMDMDMDGIKPIQLSDIAQVITTDNSKDVYAVVNGNPAVMISLEKQTGFSTGEVSDKIKAKFDRLMDQDSDLNITPLMDQGVYIDLIVNSVIQNMLLGGLFAIIVLFLFLKDLKLTFVVACSIPISLITAIVLMYFSGITINIISLSGLALGVGMLVDNSIVVIENIYRLRSEGMPSRKAAVEGARQVSGAILASTLTTVCVFLPIVFTEGITRQLFVDMGLTIAYSLFASLLISLTLVPMMGSGLLKNTKEKNNKWFDKVKAVYGAGLEIALRFKPIVLILAVILLALSVVGAMSNGTSFMPSMESTQATVTLTPPKDATLEETASISEEAMSRILEIDDVETVGAMAGGSGGLDFSGGSSESAVTMYLILKEDKELSGAQLNKLILEKTADLKAELTVNTESMDMSALGGSGISVVVKGKDLDKLQEIASEVEKIVESVKGTIEVSDGLEETTPEFRIIVNKEKASKYNLTVAQVFQDINTKVKEASSATTINTDTKDYDVYVLNKKDQELKREDLEKAKITITEKDGNEKEISLAKVVDFVEIDGPTSINRDAQERYQTVSAAVDDNYNIGLVGNEIEKKLQDYDTPEGYSVVMSGENETINDAIGQVVLMLLLAVAFMYLIMVAQFQSLLSPFIIMFTVPLAFTGGFFGLFFSNNEISVIAMIGFVMLSGIIVNNGIVLVDYINHLRKGGMNKKSAIVTAGKTRLRPIIMTSFTTILGLSTLAFGLGMGADMIQPMAIVTIGGLIYGTLLTLFVIPCIYDVFNRNKSMVEEDI
jgi:multidrug efflux pump subunit AcrB